MAVVGAITPKLEQTEIERAGRKPTEASVPMHRDLRGMAAFYTRKSGSLYFFFFLDYRAIAERSIFAAALRHGLRIAMP